MPAKKKAAKKPAPSLDRQVEALANTLMGDSRLSSFITGGGACDVAQRALLTLADERDQARKDLADARRGREAWFHKAVELECRVAELENQLSDAQVVRLIVEKHVAAQGEEPRDAPTTRFSREFRG